VLQFVLASFGTNAGFGTSLTEALNDVLESGTLSEEDTSGVPTGGGGGGGGGADGGGGGGGGGISPEALDLLQQAVDTFAEADEALQAGDAARWAELTEEAEDLVKRAQVIANNPIE